MILSSFGEAHTRAALFSAMSQWQAAVAIDRALKGSDGDKCRYLTWDVTALTPITVAGCHGLECRARGLVGKPWLRITAYPGSPTCDIAIGRMRRLLHRREFVTRMARRSVPLMQLNTTIHRLCALPTTGRG